MKRADIHTEHINNLILSFLNRTISSTDLKVLKEWIDENEDNKAYFSEIQKIWLISSIYEKKNFDKLKDRAFQQFKDRIAQKNQEQDIYICLSRTEHRYGSMPIQNYYMTTTSVSTTAMSRYAERDTSRSAKTKISRFRSYRTI